MSDEPSLAGEWHKVDAPECAAGYPEFLTFSAGRYTGRRGESQGFVRWDAGIFRLEGGRLVLSGADDRLVAYAFDIDGDLLRITDPEGCTFSYRRV
ncbi:hypothetical protein JIG36_15865 [Actinoplanes sp. LDG1-06]|uniref:Lipocalin-like domain-containing protein n=1 Tax=Paractinoplanes ovalisporus TaxID=2810368 RepID=A0ABS2AB36_9ACTN|nr:hypothetical protein [Actinoplanes ovalisporus]MBM2617034.1 hypothetical protein [Actinoplanes ovalisporus]